MCFGEARTNKFVWGLQFALKNSMTKQRPDIEVVAPACIAKEVLAE